MPTDTIKWIEINLKVLDTINDNRSIIGSTEIGCLYSIQYKSIFGAPDKVRCDTCDNARPLSQVWGIEPNTSLGYELAEPTHHHHIIA